MLRLVNEERAKVGAEPVVLGNNIAAQLHAESALENCYASHWGIDGLKPYMRYSLAGGYQSNGENGHGSDYCIVASDFYRPITNIRIEIMDAIEGWMDSPGHRRNMLDPHHRKLNIGLAWDRYNFRAYQHFEGDYVDYDRMPAFEVGVLVLSGSLKNGMSFENEGALDVHVYYDPPTYPLTPGQVSRTYCYGLGRLIADLRPELTDGRYYTEDGYEYESERDCPDPYDIPPDAPTAQSLSESHDLWQQAHDASQNGSTESYSVPLVDVPLWKASGNEFSVEVPLSGLLNEYGPGVYTVVLWNIVDNDDVVISEYSIYYDVEPPSTYTWAGDLDTERSSTR